MTTPEKQRRREFLFIGLVGVVMVAFLSLSVWNDHKNDVREKNAKERDDKQTAAFQQCIVTQVRGIGNYLDARSGTTKRNNDAIDTVVEQEAIAVAKSDLAMVQKALRDYGKTRKQIETDRANAKLPLFPDGKCAPVGSK